MILIFDRTCPRCSNYREPTDDELAYEAAVEALIDAARAVGRTEEQVRWDLKDGFRWHRIADVAALDPDVVRQWWVDAEKRAMAGMVG